MQKVKDRTPPRLDGSTINYEELECSQQMMIITIFSQTKLITSKFVNDYTNNQVHKL